MFRPLIISTNSAKCSAIGWLPKTSNMIGKTVKIIAFIDGVRPTVMYNPEITFKAAPYETEEGCLSLLGGPRKTTRWQKITVKYQDAAMRVRTKAYSGFTAQIIQHEIDHCNGILI